jgi:hypothetical protein
LGFDSAGGVSFPIEPVVPESFDMLVLPAGRGFIDPEDGDFDIDESGDPGVDPTPATPPGPDEPDPPVVACAHAPALTVSATMLAIMDIFMMYPPQSVDCCSSINSNEGDQLWFRLGPSGSGGSEFVYPVRCLSETEANQLTIHLPLYAGLHRRALGRQLSSD